MMNFAALLPTTGSKGTNADKSSAIGSGSGSNIRSSITPRVLAAPIGMRLNRTWNIECPPAKLRMLGGTLVPTARSALTLGGRLTRKSKRQRRIAIEIHGPEYFHHPAQQASGSSSSSSSSSSRKTNTPQSELPPRGLTRESNPAAMIQLSKELMDDDKIVIRILKPRKVWGFSRDYDDSSSSSSSSSEEDGDDDESDNDEKAKVHTHEPQDGWVEYRKYGVDEIINEEITGRQKNSFEATMGLGANQERRELKFETDEQGMCLN
jgi:hypothetical protein